MALQWQVGETQPVTYGVGQKYGYGFSIQNARGAPLVNITYATKEESERAEAALREALEKAVDIISFKAI